MGGGEGGQDSTRKAYRYKCYRFTVTFSILSSHELNMHHDIHLDSSACLSIDLWTNVTSWVDPCTLDMDSVLQHNYTCTLYSVQIWCTFSHHT